MGAGEYLKCLHYIIDDCWKKGHAVILIAREETSCVGTRGLDTDDAVSFKMCSVGRVIRRAEPEIKKRMETGGCVCRESGWHMAIRAFVEGMYGRALSLHSQGCRH